MRGRHVLAKVVTGATAQKLARRLPVQPTLLFLGEPNPRRHFQKERERGPGLCDISGSQTPDLERDGAPDRAGVAHSLGDFGGQVREELGHLRLLLEADAPVHFSTDRLARLDAGKRPVVDATRKVVQRLADFLPKSALQAVPRPVSQVLDRVHAELVQL